MTLLLCLCLHRAGASGTTDSLLHRTLNNDPIIAADTPSCILPFSRAGNLIIVKAKVDSLEGNFILDTGSPDLVLNLTYFRNYPITEHTDEEQAGITSSTATVRRTMLKEVSFGTFHYYRTSAGVLDLSHIENSKGVKVLGLLGMQLFKQCEMMIDYEKNLIHLHHVSRKEASTYQHEMLKDTSAYSTFPIDLTGNKVVLKTEMAGKRIRLLVDCAAESNILDSRLPNKVFEQVTINERVMLNGAGSTKVEALYGNLQVLRIGTRIVENLPVVVTNLEKSCLSFDGCIDGILGFDFLSLHKVGFNFVNSKMYIWK